MSNTTTRRPVVLITGGAGFIGSTLALRLADRCDVRIFDTFARNAMAGTGLEAHPAVTLVRGDVLDGDGVAAAMQGVDQVYHLASIAGVATVLNHPVRTMRVAIQGTFAVLDAAIAQPVPPRVVVFSTSEVYGRQARNVSESDDTAVGPVSQSRWTYASAKLAVEHVAHAFGREHGLKVATVRPFNVYGPRQVGEGAIHHFVRKALLGEPLVVHNDGAQLRSWLFVDDMVTGTIATMERDEAVGQAFNLGNPQATVSVRELAELVVEVSGSSSPIVSESRDYPDIEVRIPSIDRARTLLGFAPEVDLRAGIERTIAWYRTGA